MLLLGKQQNVVYLKIACFLETCIPAKLQLSGYQAILRINGLVPSCCQACLISSLLQFEFKRTPLLLALVTHLVRRIQGCFDRVPADGSQHRVGYGLICSQTAERDTPAFAVVNVGALAVVTEHRCSDSCVGNVATAVLTGRGPGWCNRSKLNSYSAPFMQAERAA